MWLSDSIGVGRGLPVVAVVLLTLDLAHAAPASEMLLEHLDDFFERRQDLDERLSLLPSRGSARA